MVSFRGRRPPSRPGLKRKGRGGPSKKKRGRKITKPKKALAPPVNTIENTGMEALYLKELVEDEVPVVVVLNTGEKIRGVVRYYDRDCFSLGPADGSPKMFLRKDGVRYMYEE